MMKYAAFNTNICTDARPMYISLIVFQNLIHYTTKTHTPTKLFLIQCIFFLFTMAQQSVVSQGLPIVEDSRSHSVRHTTVSRTPLDEWPAPRRDLCLTTHNTHKRQTSMPSVGFEPKIPGKRSVADPRLRPRGH